MAAEHFRTKEARNFASIRPSGFWLGKSQMARSAAMRKLARLRVEDVQKEKARNMAAAGVTDQVFHSIHSKNFAEIVARKSSFVSIQQSYLAPFLWHPALSQGLSLIEPDR